MELTASWPYRSVIIALQLLSIWRYCERSADACRHTHAVLKGCLVIELLTLDRFSQSDREHEGAGYCKWFQRIQMAELCQRFHNFENACEIGCHDYFEIIKKFPTPKFILDPYSQGGGEGLDAVPRNFPYPAVLLRCMLGQDSGIVPSNLLDFCFSVSVIEHIGQAEVGYDCSPTDDPPPMQEQPRDAFCRELFRMMRPGGITIHSVDHAPRNRTYVQNFLRAGFRLLFDDPMPSLEELLDRPDALRQRHAWLDRFDTMSPEEQRLHSVLTLGFRKPTA